MNITDIIEILDYLNILEAVESAAYREWSLIQECGNPTSKFCKNLEQFRELISIFRKKGSGS